MPFISRSTLGAEFFDTTSAMLLVEPEPQYFHAALMKLALGASMLSTPSSLGLAGRDGIGGQGAPYAGIEDGRLILDDAISTEAIKVVPELGKAPGHTVRINRPVFSNTTYTMTSREVANGATISTTPIDVSSAQTAITLKRYAGPYDSTNSRVAPLGVDRFDASMPVHKVADIVGLHLKRDLDKTLDAFGVSLFDLASTTVRPRGFSADNDSLVAGDAPMDFNTLSRADKSLDEANIPYFGNGKRVCVLTPQQIQQLEEDSQFARHAVFDKPVNPVLSKAYYKSIGKFDIYKSNTLTVTNNSSSVPIHTGQAFGPGMVGVGVGMLPRVADSTADNFGEHALVIWLAYLGFSNLDSRFGCLIKTS